MDILDEFCFGRRVLPILEVDDVKDVRPGALVTVNALGLAIALTTIDGWKAGGLHSLDQALRSLFSSDENFSSCALSDVRHHFVVVIVLEEHRRVHDRDRVDKLGEPLGQLLSDLLPDQVELLVCDLLQRGSFHVDDDADLVHNTTQLSLDDVKLFTPCVLKLAYYEFCDGLGTSLAQNLI